MAATVLYTHEIALQHGRATRDGEALPHPEQPGRLRAILARIDADPRFGALMRRDAPLAEADLIKKYHDPDYVDRALAPVAEGQVVAMDPETNKTFASAQAALRAVGAACAAVDAVVNDPGVERAFVAMRPPGHHAEYARAMGFCLFGNTAIAAREALLLPGIERVAVVDFDVHHGNGTQDLLWDEPNAMLVTSQQMPLWPGTGAPSDTGAHGQILNVPVPPGTDGRKLRELYEDQVFPALRAFAPDLLILSAGFDAHRDDPLAELNWEDEDFAWLTQELVAIARAHCQGRLVSCLEGGYNLDALASAVATHLAELME